ncbi:hypothetical protein GJV85_13350 (plasmid) [Sulfurimonas aquatica]|uniref:Peptidase C-terminal archaeal/bacterial domain-containing protein n=1 Tax=Sulfurimonas aquatica TaxID=2672570 RepID=A0A975B2Q7_9BACT|nr:hypothetical protein [Sulfurimonas aquatica]QSZ43156.1 hypothetical protein GJV85_13350 [Sulfurimonas aquatica]
MKKSVRFVYRNCLVIFTLLIVGCGGGSESAQSSNEVIKAASDFDAAVEINISSTQLGDVNLETDNLVDYYKIDLNATGTYSLYLASLAGGTNVSYVYLLNAEVFNTQGITQGKVKVQYEYFNSTGTENVVAEFTANTIGTYYIKVYRARFDEPDAIATSYKFRIEPSVANGLEQNADLEYNDTFSQAAPLTLEKFSDDVNGTLNTTQISDHFDWYDLKDLKVGKYTIFFKSRAGTISAPGENIVADIYNNNAIAYTNYRMDLSYGLDGEGKWDRRVFEVTTPGSYFLRLYRVKSKAASYSFRVVPSVDNGLTQDSNDEPNDEIHLAKEISLSSSDTMISNSISTTDILDSNDWYKFTSDISGSVSVKVETLSATESGTYGLLVDLINENGVVVKTIPSSQYTLSSANLYINDTFTLENNATYYLHIYRTYNVKTAYKITLTK